ncbi:hypothetical protein B9Z19DRAFT_1129071 [Tuber borchii]|uniref:Uncharacterized protein n=1 Tax=Tuber borchii TaxID=42251 RepID=A0A2T6ZMX7_TUBBO|nr:hypothetical protein B9Z19DRAFT_1129071 [Tuber borchii]
MHLKEKGRFWTLHEEGKTLDERSIMYRLPDEKTKNRVEGVGGHLTLSGCTGLSGLCPEDVGTQENVKKIFQMRRQIDIESGVEVWVVGVLCVLCMRR